MSVSKLKKEIARRSEAGLSTGAIVAIVLGTIALIVTLIGVILVGLVAAPAYVNQNKRANDAAVETDVRNTATAVEEALIADPNSQNVEVHSSGTVATIKISGETVNTIHLADGVTVETKEAGSANGYIIYGYHVNGSAFVEDDPLVYNSATGGF